MLLKDSVSHPDYRSWTRMQDWFVCSRQAESVKGCMGLGWWRRCLLEMVIAMETPPYDFMMDKVSFSELHRRFVELDICLYWLVFRKLNSTKFKPIYNDSVCLLSSVSVCPLHHHGIDAPTACEGNCNENKYIDKPFPF